MNTSVAKMQQLTNIGEGYMGVSYTKHKLLKISKIKKMDEKVSELGPWPGAG